MIKKIIVCIASLLFMTPILAPATYTSAQGTDTHIVQKGESMWLISVKYQIGLSEIIQANPNVKNPALIYPNQKLVIPNIDNVKNLENDVIALVNTERAKQHLEGLEIDWELSRVARVKSKDMAVNNYFSHQSPTYGSPFDMMKHFGIHYTSAGENIASGQTSAESVMQSWMNSQGHRENIMNPTFTHIGVGYYRGGSYGHMWTQQFITK